jgi:hypothetical protein
MVMCLMSLFGSISKTKSLIGIISRMIPYSGIKRLMQRDLSRHVKRPVPEAEDACSTTTDLESVGCQTQFGTVLVQRKALDPAGT